MRSILLWLLFSSLAVAQTSAKIVGPTEAPAGELVVLSSTGSVGDNLVWIKPDTLQTLSVGCSVIDTQIVFATVKPGRYEFVLIVADTKANIDYAKHVVTIKGSTAPPVDPPKDPPKDPPPANKWDDLKLASAENANKVNDPTTRSRLKASIAAVILELEPNPPSLEVAKERVRKAIETTLLTRTGQSMLADWVPWRKGNQAQIDKLGLVDFADYLSAVKAIGAGL